MQWIVPSEKDTASATLEKQLWAAADQLRANSCLKAAEFSVPVLKKFGEATIPMADQIHTLQRQIQTLRQTRDLLLPRLLSGHQQKS